MPIDISDSEDDSDFVKAIAEVRRLGTRKGHCYHHVQAIMPSIDQYAESAGQPRVLLEQTAQQSVEPA